MNFNFDFEIDNNILPYWKWSDKDKFLREINRLLTNIKNIKTSDIIKEYEGTLDLINIIYNVMMNTLFSLIKQIINHLKMSKQNYSKQSQKLIGV